MSREAYQAPSMGSSQNLAPRPIDPPKAASMNYICGDCGLNTNQHQVNPFLRCKECGCRILYKERTKRMVQFEAR